MRLKRLTVEYKNISAIHNGQNTTFWIRRNYTQIKM